MSTASTPAAAPSPPRVVLGSQSVGRRQCLQRAGIAFEAMPADIDERAVTVAAGGGSRETADPQLLTLAIARAKAQALLPRLRGQDRLLITSDQVVHYDGRIREKPATPEECRSYLRSYETAPAVTVTAVVVTHTLTGASVEGVDVAKQWFKPIPEAVMEQLIAKGDVMYCCGGFIVDDPLIQPYLGPREGDEDSIIGLPMALTLRLMKQLGYEGEKSS